MCKGGNLNTFNQTSKIEDQANLSNNLKSLAVSYAYNKILFRFGVGLVHFK